jgi:hypothetical protein
MMAKKTVFLRADGKFFIGGNLYVLPDGRHSEDDLNKMFADKFKETGMTAKALMDHISAVTIQPVDSQGNIIESQRPSRPFKLEIEYEKPKKVKVEEV